MIREAARMEMPSKSICKAIAAGGDACMVGSDYPIGVESTHPVIADERIHQRLLKSMPHMQRSRDVGWGKLNAIGQLFGVSRGGEVTARLPYRIPAALYVVGLEALGQFHHVSCGPSCFVRQSASSIIA